MSYFETDYVTISWDDTIKSVCVQWHKFALSEQLRLSFNKIIELLELKRGNQVLADTRNQGVIGLTDQDWINQDWYPRAVKAGYTRIAVILSKSIITKMSINRIMSEEHPGLEESYFDEIDKAREWLLEKAPVSKTKNN